MQFRCWAEIDLQALRENLAWLRHRVGPGVRIITVVKADAYGHGLKDIARLLMQSGTDIFGVANLAEAEADPQRGQGLAHSDAGRLSAARGGNRGAGRGHAHHLHPGRSQALLPGRPAPAQNRRRSTSRWTRAWAGWGPSRRRHCRSPRVSRGCQAWVRGLFTHYSSVGRR